MKTYLSCFAWPALFTCFIPNVAFSSQSSSLSLSWGYLSCTHDPSEEQRKSVRFCCLQRTTKRRVTPFGLKIINKSQKPSPCEMVTQGPVWPQTLFPPVFPGLLGILGTPADGISCQHIAGTTWHGTTKEQTQGTVGQAARRAATMNEQRAATPSTSCCVPQTSRLSAAQPFRPPLSL